MSAWQEPQVLVGAKYNATPLALADGQHIIIQVDADGSLFVNVRDTSAATMTDRSGTITLGGTAQPLMAANPNRKGYLIQNNSAGVLWFNELGVAAVLAAPSISIAAGALYQSPSPGASALAISIIGATTGQAFTAREW
jgi:hypothetical protein